MGLPAQDGPSSCRLGTYELSARSTDENGDGRRLRRRQPFTRRYAVPSRSPTEAYRADSREALGARRRGLGGARERAPGRGGAGLRSGCRRDRAPARATRARARGRPGGHRVPRRRAAASGRAADHDRRLRSRWSTSRAPARRSSGSRDVVEFKAMEAEWIDLATASVDGVLCRWGYMLLADPEAALRETRRVLRPGRPGRAGGVGRGRGQPVDRRCRASLGASSARAEPPTRTRRARSRWRDPDRRARAARTAPGFADDRGRADRLRLPLPVARRRRGTQRGLLAALQDARSPGSAPPTTRGARRRRRAISAPLRAGRRQRRDPGADARGRGRARRQSPLARP